MVVICRKNVKTKWQGRAEQGRSGQGRAGQGKGRAGQGRGRQGRAGQDRCCVCHAVNKIVKCGL